MHQGTDRNRNFVQQLHEGRAEINAMRCVLKPSINWELELQISDNQEVTFTGPSDFITGNCQRTITMWGEGN